MKRDGVESFPVEQRQARPRENLSKKQFAEMKVTTKPPIPWNQAYRAKNNAVILQNQLDACRERFETRRAQHQALLDKRSQGESAPSPQSVRRAKNRLLSASAGVSVMKRHVANWADAYGSDIQAWDEFYSDPEKSRAYLKAEHEELDQWLRSQRAARALETE